MLAVLEAAGRLFAFPASRLLRQLAFIAVPGCRQSCPEPFWIAAGIGVLCGLGILGGVLHAASQQRISAFGLFSVGAFYGVFLWVIGGLVSMPVGGGELRRLIRSWPWLSACLAYGMWLSLVAAWADRRRPAAAVIVPLD
jgi:hypothetical protein